MKDIVGTLKTFKSFFAVFVAILLLAFQYFFIYFINSAYLKQYVGEDAVGYVFTIGAVFNIILFLTAPKILRRFGNFKLILSLTILEFIAIATLACTGWAPLVLFLLIIHFTISNVLLYCLDVFLQKTSSIKEIGSIRGIYLTMNNIPPVITPFIAGFVLDNTNTNYWKVYAISAAFLIPFFFLILYLFRNFKDAKYPVIPFKETINTFLENISIRDICIDNILLQLFYGVMVIYTPIYLHDYIGFGWEQIGIMFSIMLLPFIFFQIPLGHIEDRKHDEKHILIIGFAIMASATILMPFIIGPNFWLWTSLLFVTRIGASFIEVACESYFFRHITADNVGFISFYRITRAIPYLILPAIVTITFYFFDFKYIFLILGLIMLLGIRYAFQLKDR